MRLRNRYHAVRGHAVWPKVKALVKGGDTPGAEALIKTTIADTPRLQARQRGSLEARRRKRAFLQVQAAAEQEIRAALATLADRATSALNRVAGPDGTISPGRLHGALERLKVLNREAYRTVNGSFLRLVKAGARSGIKAGMAIGEAVVGHARAQQAKETAVRPPEGQLVTVSLREDDEEEPESTGPDPYLQTIKYSVDSGVFQRIFQGALRQTMEAGLFGKTGVSNRVWDLRDGNYAALKRVVSAGIAAGKSAVAISQELRRLLLNPASMSTWVDYQPGPGIYKSAMGNAMRLARTESNRAYGAAGALFAEQKEWTVLWHVSDGQREEDECDDLDGQEMTADEFMAQFPQHPNCLCYFTYVVPEVG